MKPRILPCLHSFCEQCLYKEIERSGTMQNMECPTCQRSITIPEGGINAIPQNLHLGFEVEVAGYMSKIGSEGEKSCDACIDGSMEPAVVFCCTCHHLLCKPCHDYHKHNKILQHHQIVGLDKKSLELLPFVMKPTEHLCSQLLHKTKDLKSFCETYQLLNCKKCTLVLHNDLRIAELCKIAQVHRDAMIEALRCAQEVIFKLIRAIDANDKMAEQVEISRNNVTLIITLAFEQLHQTIEERKKTLLSEMDAISLSKTTALAIQKEQLMKMQEEINRYTEMTSHILQTHTDHEMIALGDLLPTELMATLKKTENVSLTPTQTSDIHVSLRTNYLIKELSIFGHVMDSPPSPSQSTWSSMTVAKVKEMYHVKVETMTSKEERYPYGGLQVTAKLRPKPQDVPGEVEDNGDGTYTITLTPQTAGPHQLLITMEGQHVQKSPCDLYMRRGNDFKEPYGLALDPQGNIHVAANGSNTIKVFTPEGSYVRSYGDDVKRPSGLLIDEEGYSLVNERSGGCLSIFDPKGNKIHTVSNLNGPRGVMLDAKSGSLVVHFSHYYIFGTTWPVTLVSEVDDAMTEDSCVNVDSAYTKVVRYCARPPTKFTAKTDWELWLMRFDAYADEAKIEKEDRGKEMLSLLVDEPFRLVYQNGLVESKDYSAVCECLTLRYGKTGMGLEWQMKLQCRVQRPGESLLDFAGELRMIASKAFPDHLHSLS
eukprot:Em0004g1367a